VEIDPTTLKTVATVFTAAAEEMKRWGWLKRHHRSDRIYRVAARDFGRRDETKTLTGFGDNKGTTETRFT